MKKIILWVLPLLAFAACEYDDTEVRNRLDGLDDQVAELRQQVESLNEELSTLGALLAGKQFISGVTDNGDGSYTLTLVTSAGASTTVTIRDGKDAVAPRIGVKQDTDGTYYWTLDGEFITDAGGGKLPVSGEDGTTPRFKIDGGYWYVSYDGETTWTRLGKATGEDGTAFFKSVVVSEDGTKVHITLQDDTVLTFDLYVEFGIAFDMTTGALRVGGSISVPFALTGADAKTVIETLPAAGWQAAVKRAKGADTGTIEVTAPADSSTGKVVVLVNDGSYKTLMRTLTFVAGVLNVSTTSGQATAAGGPVTIEVETDLDYTVRIPEAAKSWITLAETRAEVREETLTFNVVPNTLPEPREAIVELICNGSTIETVLIYQLAYHDPSAMVFKVEAKAYTSTNAKYTNMVYLPLYGAVNVSIDWGDGNTSVIDETISTAAAMPNHTYHKAGFYYVTITGNAAQLTGNLAPTVLQPAIVEVIQWGKLGFGSLIRAFSGNKSLKTVPSPEADAFAAVTTAESMFTGCTALETVPADLLAGAPELTSVASMFYNCAALESVPGNLFEKNTKITTAGSLFSGCAKLTAVPEELFRTTPEIKTLSSLFAKCSALESVPEKLFASLTEADNMASIFTECTSLQTVPADLFKNQSKVKNIAMMFKGCKALESIPEGLLDTFTEATNMNSLFSTCPRLVNLPADIFRNLTNVTSAGYLYEGCVSMTEFPSIKNCVKLKTVNALWKDCSTLVSAPADYFPDSEEIRKGTTAAYMFQNCSALKNVPEGMFDNLTGVTIISQMFENCTSLETLPAGLFDKMTAIKTASKTFNGCTAFTGESPYTLIEGNKIHLYDRAPANGYTAITSFADCFKNCANIADLNLIPIAWGGKNDGTKDKPTLTLALTPIDGAEYYGMNISIKGTELKSGRYGLFTKARAEQFYKEMGDNWEKVCNRNCTGIPASWLTDIHSQDGFQGEIKTLEADTEYMLLVSGTNIHGTTVERYIARTAPYPTGDPAYERYVGTWTVTSTSSEISQKPLTFDITIEPYRINERFRVYNWGITTFCEEMDAPFAIDYVSDGSVSVSTEDYIAGLGDGFYLYLKYRFHNPAIPGYSVWTTGNVLMTGTFSNEGERFTLAGKEFTDPSNNTQYTVCGMDYFLYKGGNWYENAYYTKPGYTTGDYAIGPYTLTRTSTPAKASAARNDRTLTIEPIGDKATVQVPTGAAQVKKLK